MKVEQNIARLKHLLELFKMSADELLTLASEGLTNRLNHEQVFSRNIDVSILKRLDKIFNKGLHYYLDPSAPVTAKDASIFFRKDSFATELNLGAKKIVNQFEEFKLSLSAIAKLSDLEFKREYPVISKSESPKIVAHEVRKSLYPVFDSVLRDFLKALIVRLAEHGILVFEFVETWNKREKANIDGFFLQPNVIVLKRQQSAFRREIFTLVHELGHYLIAEEEVESLEIDRLAEKDATVTEKWCNDFAYYFLIGSFDDKIETIHSADSTNDYCHDLIAEISSKTHLSKLALFTRLLNQGKISRENYFLVRADFEAQFKKKKEAEEKQKEIDKALGVERRGSVSKPINSPLLVSTLQAAFYEGVISEYDVGKALNIKPEQVESYLQ